MSSWPRGAGETARACFRISASGGDERVPGTQRNPFWEQPRGRRKQRLRSHLAPCAEINDPDKRNLKPTFLKNKTKKKREKI